MAKFKVGERAVYIGRRLDAVTGPGSEVEIESIGYHPEEPPGMFERACKRFPNEVIYGVQWLDCHEGGYIPESELEKIIPKHQEDDLKTAEPLFTQTWLPRWLGQEEVKHEEA